MDERFIFDGTQQQLVEMCKEKDLSQFTLITKWDDFEIYFNKMNGLFQCNITKWWDICCYYLPEGVERPYGQDTLNDIEDILLKMGANTEFINKLINLLNDIPDIDPIYEDEYYDKIMNEVDNILGFDISKIDTSNAREMTQKEINDMNEMENI